VIHAACAGIEGADLSGRRGQSRSESRLAQQRPEETEHRGIDITQGESMEGRYKTVEELWVRIVWFEHSTNALERVPRTRIGAW
jgi:hypothetical protein